MEMYRTVTRNPDGGPDIVSDWAPWDGFPSQLSVNRSTAEGMTMYMPGSNVPALPLESEAAQEPLENE